MKKFLLYFLLVSAAIDLVISLSTAILISYGYIESTRLNITNGIVALGGCDVFLLFSFLIIKKYEYK